MSLLLFAFLLSDEREIIQLLSEKRDDVRAKNETTLYHRGLDILPALASLAETGDDPVRGRASDLRTRIASGYAEAALGDRPALNRIRIYLYPEPCLCGEAKVRGLAEVVRRMRDEKGVLDAYAGPALLPPKRGDAVVLVVFLKRDSPVEMPPIRRAMRDHVRLGGLGLEDRTAPGEFFDRCDVLLELLGQCNGRNLEIGSGQKFLVTEPSSKGWVRAVIARKGLRGEARSLIPRPRSSDPRP